MTDLGAERERDLECFLTFVDAIVAIVAIAITLLVLPLVEVAGSYRGDSVSSMLHEHTDQIWAFFLSFTVIADLWLTQHRLLRNVVASTPAMLRLLLLWTLTIVVLPFPTALVASIGHEGATNATFVAALAVMLLVPFFGYWPLLLLLAPARVLDAWRHRHGSPDLR
jgi:uncharacterized membrane protein